MCDSTNQGKWNGQSITKWYLINRNNPLKSNLYLINTAEKIGGEVIIYCSFIPSSPGDQTFKCNKKVNPSFFLFLVCCSTFIYKRIFFYRYVPVDKFYHNHLKKGVEHMGLGGWVNRVLKHRHALFTFEIIWFWILKSIWCSVACLFVGKRMQEEDEEWRYVE